MASDIFQILGLAGIAFAGAAWLVRELVKAGLRRDLERHKAYLQIANQERQIVFASLHKERADLLRELYRTLPSLATRVLRLGQALRRHPEVASSSDTITTVKDLTSEFGHLRERYEENRILLPESLCRKIDDLINLIALAFESGARPGEGPSLNQQLAEVRAALEKEFRVMSGVESEPPVPAKRPWFSALCRRINDLTLSSSGRAADVKTVHE